MALKEMCTTVDSKAPETPNKPPGALGGMGETGKVMVGRVMVKDVDNTKPYIPYKIRMATKEQDALKNLTLPPSKPLGLTLPSPKPVALEQPIVVPNSVGSGVYLTGVSAGREVRRLPDFASAMNRLVKEFPIMSDGSVSFNGRRIMNCSVRIDKTNKGEKRSTYEVSIFMYDQVIHKTVPVKDFASGKWLFELPGFLLPDREMRKYIYNYLSLVVEAMALMNQVYSVRKPGYHDLDGNLVYVTPSGVIGNSSIQAIAQYGQSFKLGANDRKGDIQAILSMVHLTPNSWVAPVIVLYTFVSFSYGLYKRAGFTPKFLLFLTGPSGAGKTSLAKAMTQIERIETPKFMLKSTAAGLEAGFREYKDAVMLVDDLAPMEDGAEEKRMLSNLELLARSFGDGTGKKRNHDYQDSSFEVEQYEAEGGAIITGEYVASIGSSLARMLILPLEKNGIDFNKLSVVQEHPCLASFMAGFIEFLVADSKRIISLIAEHGKLIRANVQNQYAHSRFGEYYAQLHIAAEILIDYGTATRQLDENEAAYWRNFFEGCIGQAIAYNDKRFKLDSPITKLCIAIIAEIEQNLFPIRPYGRPVGKGESVVLEDKDYFYIRPQDVYEIYEVYKRQNGIKTVERKSTQLAKLLVDAGIVQEIIEGTAPSPRKAGKIRGYKNLRSLKLNKQKLMECANPTL